MSAVDEMSAIESKWRPVNTDKCGGRQNQVVKIKSRLSLDFDAALLFLFTQAETR
jgi:hypothetical protein